MVPDVTIVTPFRDPGSCFELALKSVFAQTLTNWELILIDDGSRDESLSFARSLRDPRVRVFSDGRRRRQQVRRNEAIALASAPYIALMDADDIMHPRPRACLHHLSSRTSPPGRSIRRTLIHCPILGQTPSTPPIR